ncbi:hypothetical protein IKS57_00865 [bacterium]|nr:hypothetical protein [bacterium]
MATKTLTSKIRLCKGINLDRDYVNVLNYTESQMVILCESQDHLVASANDYSFIRNKGSISTNFDYDDALQSNYIAFQNKDYSNKWFFAWIDEVIYNGESNTEIKYTIDVWSTWFDYWTAKTCFVSREHVNNDTIGANTVPEDLNIEEVEEYGNTETYSTKGTSNDYYYIVMTSFDPTLGTDGDFTGVNIVNGNLFGSKIFAFACPLSDTVGFVETNLRNFLIAVNNKSKIDSIQAIFIAPRIISRKFRTNSKNRIYRTSDKQEHTNFMI